MLLFYHILSTLAMLLVDIPECTYKHFHQWKWKGQDKSSWPLVLLLFGSLHGVELTLDHVLFFFALVRLATVAARLPILGLSLAIHLPEIA